MNNKRFEDSGVCTVIILAFNRLVYKMLKIVSRDVYEAAFAVQKNYSCSRVRSMPLRFYLIKPEIK